MHPGQGGNQRLDGACARWVLAVFPIRAARFNAVQDRWQPSQSCFAVTSGHCSVAVQSAAPLTRMRAQHLALHSRCTIRSMLACLQAPPTRHATELFGWCLSKFARHKLIAAAIVADVVQADPQHCLL